MRVLTLVCLVAFSLVPGQSAVVALQPAGSIPLPGVEGRIDHLAVDLDGRRIFLAALGSDAVEVIDLKTSAVTKSLPGFHEPQGIRFLPEARRVVIANGGDGSARFLDGTSFATIVNAALSGDADNVRYDNRARRVYVGYGNGALAVLDVDGKQLGTVRLDAHPEAFQLDSPAGRLYVNVPSAGHIAVVDAAALSVTAKWPVSPRCANYPMALDETRHRLFTGCRSPAKLLVYDMTSGAVVASVDIVGDTDDLFYDSATQRLYVIGGAGSVTVIEQQDADHYRPIQTIATAAGARTGLFVPELHQLFVAVPHRGAQPAELRLFSTAR